jgi:acetyl esterase/lipase
VIHDPGLNVYVAEQRRVVAALAGGMPPSPPAAVLLPADELQLPGTDQLRVRVIRPPGAVAAAMLHIHGGGFSFGTPAMGDDMNSHLALEAGIATVSVDYRLAPAHAHPAAVNDCLAAALWLQQQAPALFGTRRLLIGGESVGASLAVMTLLRLRDQHDAARLFSGANLVVGAYDFAQTPSQRQSTDALFLSPARLRATVEGEFPGLGPEQLRDPAISTLYADLRRMPPALFSVGTEDAVLDDSLFMAARWRAAGNRAQLEVYPEAPHFFMALPTAMAAEGRRRIVAFLRSCIAG